MPDNKYILELIHEETMRLSRELEQVKAKSDFTHHTVTEHDKFLDGSPGSLPVQIALLRSKMDDKVQIDAEEKKEALEKKKEMKALVLVILDKGWPLIPFLGTWLYVWLKNH